MNEFENKVVEALKAIKWGAEVVTIGSYSAWHLATETPAFKFDTVVRILPESERLVVLRARSSFDLELASYLLSRVSDNYLQSCSIDRVLIALDFKCRGRRYDGIGVAPPAVAKTFAPQSQFLAQHAYWVFPVMKGDFRGDEDGSAFHSRLGKGGQIPIIDWNRDLSVSI